MTERYGHFLAALLLLFAIIIVAMLAALVANPAHGHDHADPARNACLEGLKAQSGAVCCDGHDATRLDDVEWRAQDGHYQVHLGDRWVNVPNSSIIQGKGCPGPTMVWPYPNPASEGVRCFMPGAGG